MLRTAREALANFANVELIEATFEAWPADKAAFGLIIAAQSWHWVAPEVRLVKAAELLSSGGSLAVFGHVPVGLPAGLLEEFKQISLRHTGAGGRRPKPGICPAVPSRVGLTSWDCSGLWSTAAIRGSGSTRQRAISIFCARDRMSGCSRRQRATSCLVTSQKRSTIGERISTSTTKPISISPAGSIAATSGRNRISTDQVTTSRIRPPRSVHSVFDRRSRPCGRSRHSACRADAKSASPAGRPAR